MATHRLISLSRKMLVLVAIVCRLVLIAPRVGIVGADATFESLVELGQAIKLLER